LLDNTLKSISVQFDINEKNIREYSTKTLKQCELLFQDEVKVIHQKIDDVKLENGKYHLEVMKKIKELNITLQEADKIKDELKTLWDEELLKLKNYHGVKFDSFLGEIRRVEVELNYLNTSVKVSILVK